MTSGILPSVVRLQPLDDCSYFVGNGVESFGRVGVSHVPVGKSDSVWIGWRPVVRDDRGTPKNVIEDRPEIMDAISENIGTASGCEPNGHEVSMVWRPSWRPFA